MQVALIGSLLFFGSVAFAETADEIMAKVAANQDATVAARKRFLYSQEVLVRIKSGQTIKREETRTYAVRPTEAGFQRDLVTISGKYADGKKQGTYTEAGYKVKDTDIDGELAKSLAEDLGGEKESRDGVERDLFPLTSEKIAMYQFRLVETTRRGEREVHRLEFRAKSKRECMAGEAVIDAREYQPVEVTSHMTCKIPFLVKTALGTNLQHLGFKVSYREFGHGVWFPVNYGGEFQLRVLFFYSRGVAIGMRNSDFRRTSAETTVAFEQP